MSGYGQIIRDLRAGAALTQRALAERIRCTDGYLAFVELERRLPSAEFIGKLLDALNPSEADRQRLLDAVVAAQRRHADRKEKAQYAALHGAIRSRGLAATETPEPLALPSAETLLATPSESEPEMEQATRYLRLAFTDSEARPAVLATLRAFAQSAQSRNESGGGGKEE